MPYKLNDSFWNQTYLFSILCLSRKSRILWHMSLSGIFENVDKSEIGR